MEIGSPKTSREQMDVFCSNVAAPFLWRAARIVEFLLIIIEIAFYLVASLLSSVHTSPRAFKHTPGHSDQCCSVGWSVLLHQKVTGSNPVRAHT